jgi:hypothetical protein
VVRVRLFLVASHVLALDEVLDALLDRAGIGLEVFHQLSAHLEEDEDTRKQNMKAAHMRKQQPKKGFSINPHSDHIASAGVHLERKKEPTSTMSC